MSTESRTHLNELMAHIEENWRNLNTLFDELAANDGWDQKHGQDWIFADLPYHLTYCNQEILIRGIKAGAALPESEQELFASPDALNAWNARKFAERPVEQSPAQSVAQWQETCEEIRHLTSEMTDADLAGPFWMPLFFGWSTTHDGLEFTLAHDWGEFMELRIHMEREEPVPSASLTRVYLQHMLGGFPILLNREAAKGQNFTAVMAFTDPGVGAFTIRVAEGFAALTLGETPDADLVMIQSATTFLKTLTKKHNPAAAMQTGEIQVSSFEGLATFGQLFPMP